ncbi:MAG: FMN-binding protein [Angelakisella sp.]|jgi:electron transport complex protein RnfG|nr:FMN-binding protein [Angelakisella sp.]
MKAVKEFVVPAAVLTAICLVVSGALAGTYQLTEPVIEAAKRAEADASRVVVLPDGKNFEEVSASGLDNIVDAYKAGNGAGYVITGKAKGYGGDLQVMAGISSDGKITGVKLMDNNETQGIGSKTGEASYTDQYKGKDSTLDGVTTISGATVSSKAFESAVNTIFQAYGSLAGVEVAGPEVTPPETIIFPDVTDFTEVALDGAKKAIKAGDAGYVIVMEGQGYSHAAGPMEIYVGVGMDGKIAGVAAGANSETAGIGSQALEPDYLKAYIGKTSPDGIDNISGATETSVGVKKLVRAAMELAPALIGDTTPKVDLTVAEDGSASAVIGAVRVEIDAAGKVAGVTTADETADLASIAPEEVKEAMDNALAAYNASKGA